jgi:hypothetical protein
MLRRFPHAALWRWPRPLFFMRISVCDINLTLPRPLEDKLGSKNLFDSPVIVHGQGHSLTRK